MTNITELGAGVESLYEDVWKNMYSDTKNLKTAADCLYALLGSATCDNPDWPILEDEI